jgi:hypothetical protein
MRDDLLRDTLASIALQALPETTDLWPAISRRLAERARPTRLRLDRRRVGFAATAAFVVVVSWTLVQPGLPSQSSTVQAADIARNDPQVAAILRGDIAIVTVTSVVNEMATVVIQDSHGEQVTVAVDLRSRIVTVIYQGPQLSAVLTEQALGLVRADPRTSSLLARGAVLGRIVPILVTSRSIDPTTGAEEESTVTWAQVPLELDGMEWQAYVDLPLGKVDQLVDPQGSQVPMP